MAPGIAAAQPLIRKLFLLHPAYPSILLELTSTTDTAVTSAGKRLNLQTEICVCLKHMFKLLFYLLIVSYQERQKDATYITVSSRPTLDSEPGARIVKSMSLRAAIAKGQIVRLKESDKAGEPVKSSTSEVKKFFRRLSFKHQVRNSPAVCFLRLYM